MTKAEKHALVKSALLAFGWPLALNHFYEGDSGSGIVAVLLTWIAWASVVGIVFWMIPFFTKLFQYLKEFEGTDGF